MARQCDLILMHILKYGSITHLEAEREYGIARLAARIADLKREGHPIISEMVEGRNRRGEPTHYARYKMEDGVDHG